MSRNTSLYIKDILEHMDRAQKYTTGHDLRSFSSDDMVCDAVIRCIEVIGEATKNIPTDIRDKYQSIPWRDMAGMRDKVIHGYYLVDLEMVWLVVTEDIPMLMPKIKKTIEDIEQ